MNYFDLHCDTITECFDQEKDLYRNDLQLSLEKGKDLERWVQTFAIWISDKRRGEAAYQYFCEAYQFFLKEINKNKEVIELCTNYEEIESALSKGKRVALLSVEGSAVLGGRLERVEELYNKGVRFMNLTWNGQCEVADGYMVENPGGLTSFGRQVVNKMNELGMIVDVSHIAEKGFWDVAELSNSPFIATHSNSKAVCKHLRNLTDDQFKEIIRRKGLVGINFYPVFINGTKEAKLEELVAHIDHFLDLGGEDVLAMGSDFDGATMPMDLTGIEDINKLLELCYKQYGNNILEKICYKNAERFIENIKK